MVAMEGDSIIDGSSIDEISGEWRDPNPESSPSVNGSTSFGHSTPQCSPLQDNWLGQKHLESLIALQLHVRADHEEAVPALELKLKASMQDFPFSQCCMYLRSNGASGHLDPKSMSSSYRKTLLCWIGHVVHEGLPDEEALIRKAITKFVDTKAWYPLIQQDRDPLAHNEWPPAHNGGTHATYLRSSIHARSPASLVEGSSGQRERTFMHNGNTARPTENSFAQNGSLTGLSESPTEKQNLSRYTSLLKENGDYYSETPVYVDQDISTDDHPRFSSRLTFRGITTEGTGRQKRLARHEASFKACQQLGLRLA